MFPARQKVLDVSRFDPAQIARRPHRSLAPDQPPSTPSLDVGANDGGYGKLPSRRQVFQGATSCRSNHLKKRIGYSSARAAKDDLWTIAPAHGARCNRWARWASTSPANSTSSSILPMGELHIAAAPDSRLYPTFSTSTCAAWMESSTPSSHGQAGAIHLKIDTQGFEMAVASGRGNACCPRVRGLQLEMSLVPLYEGQGTLTERCSNWVLASHFQTARGLSLAF